MSSDEQHDQHDQYDHAYSELKSGLLDYYKILRVLPTDTIETIKVQGKKRLMQYHPDRIKRKTTDENEIKKYATQYHLIHEALTVLRDPIAKKFYDIARKQQEEENFNVQRDSFHAYKELQEKQMETTDKSTAQIEFDKMNKKFNDKIGFKPEDVKKTLSKHEMDARIENMKLERETQEIESLHPNLFEGKKFDEKEFNKKFEKHKKHHQKKDKIDDNSIVKWEGISAYNDAGVYSDQYTPIDHVDMITSEGSSKFEKFNINDDDSGSDIGSDIEEEQPKITDEKNNKDVMDRYEQIQHERQSDITEFKDCRQNPFNVSTRFGEDIDPDIQISTRKKFNDDKNIVEAYKELIYERKK